MTLYNCFYRLSGSRHDWFTEKIQIDTFFFFFLLRCLPRMAVLDLQSDCHLPCLYLHLYNISYNRMVCTEGKIELILTSYSHNMSTYLLRVKTTTCDPFCPKTVPNYQRRLFFVWVECVLQRALVLSLCCPSLTSGRE